VTRRGDGLDRASLHRQRRAELVDDSDLGRGVGRVVRLAVRQPKRSATSVTSSDESGADRLASSDLAALVSATETSPWAISAAASSTLARSRAA